jgi:hypothetical protein
LLITNLFKALFEWWRLDSLLSILYRIIAEERKKRREKEWKSSRVVACGALFGMGFVRFFLIIIIIIPKFVYGLSHAKNDSLHFKIPPFNAF